MIYIKVIMGNIMIFRYIIPICFGQKDGNYTTKVVIFVPHPGYLLTSWLFMNSIALVRAIKILLDLNESF